MSFNSVGNHTSDKQIGLSLHGRPILLLLVWLQTEFASTQSYYHYLSSVSGWFCIVEEQKGAQILSTSEQWSGRYDKVGLADF